MVSAAWVEIRIRDNGTGIPEEVREKIFNLFCTTKPTGSEYETMTRNGGYSGILWEPMGDYGNKNPDC